MGDDRQTARNGFRFDGFSSPNGTLVPDELFDVLAPGLSEAELRVCLYIIRRTFGFKKQADDISLRQMVDGIQTRDGRVLDNGAGVVKSAAARAVKGLVEKGVVIAVRNRSADKGNEPTTYALRFKGEETGSAKGSEAHAGDPLSSKRTRVVLQENTPLSSKRTHKKQFLQETESSKGDDSSTASDSMRAGGTSRVDDATAELTAALGDAAHLASNRSQARNLQARSGLSEEQFAARMYEALSITRDRARAGDVGTQAAYFFAVLRDLAGLGEGAEHGVPAAASERGPATVQAQSPEPHGPRSTLPVRGSTRRADEAWSQVLELLASELSPATIRTYFAHSELVEVSDKGAVVSAANGYVAAQIDERFRPLVRRALAAVLARPVSVSFVAAGTMSDREEVARR